jgi:TolA-binding protein
LTFLDIQELERQGADLQSRIEELQEVNKILRNKEQMRDEMMRKASERLSALEERFETLTSAKEIERKLDREFELETDPVNKDQ